MIIGLESMVISNGEQFEKSNNCKGTAPDMLNAKIIFQKENNLIFCEPDVKLCNCNITFVGEGNLIYLSSNYYSYNLELRVYTNSCFYIGRNNYINGKLNVLVQEHQNVMIGGDGAFSYGINIMTGDAHLIYNKKDRKRINHSKSVCIGDHVWIGAYAQIYKGVQIGSGSIIGGNSVISGKTVKSESIWAGNPARKIKESIIWEKDCTNMYDEQKTMEMQVDKNCKFDVYKDTETIVFEKQDKELIDLGGDYLGKLRIIKRIRDKSCNSRFYI